MTEKQKLFCDEYLKDTNATRAYLTVYANCKCATSAAPLASKLLKKEEIQKYISEKMEEIHNENTADIQEIVEYLTSVMRAKSESYVMIMSGNGTQKVVQKPPDEKERLKAAELLGKRFGMF
ncbi:terminase small subunit, partial [Catenibacterium sp.]|uniref:terminase small subunit n=1 Tax=Catenibacterium sp. TaxID=2049022 RepID=UPI003078AAF0